jgi:predicted TIM-barrel fold metal-dependent hydrolase
VAAVTLCVDAHVHVYEQGDWPPRWFDYAAQQWAGRGPDRLPEHVRPKMEDGLADPGAVRLLSQMTTAGVDVSVLLAVDWELGMDSRPGNDIREVHERYGRLMRDSGGRIVAFAGVDPRRPDALGIFEEARDRHGLRGLKLYPPAGFYAYDEAVQPLYQACADSGLPVAIHCGETLGMLRPRFSNPLFVQDVQRLYPGLTLWIAHAGAPWWWDEAVAVAEAGVDTYLELSSWQAVAYEDEELFVRRLGRALGSVGVDKLLFGSDHISGHRVRDDAGYRRWIDWFRDLPSLGRKYGVHVTDDDVEAMLGGNAARCLGLEA